jgi:hypothetical protein
MTTYNQVASGGAKANGGTTLVQQRSNVIGLGGVRIQASNRPPFGTTARTYIWLDPIVVDQAVVKIAVVPLSTFMPDYVAQGR